MNFFGMGTMELFVVLLIALIALGPKRLPHMAQKLGVMLHQAKRQVAEARQTLSVDMDLDGSKSKTESTTAQDQTAKAPVSEPLPIKEEPAGPAEGEAPAKDEGDSPAAGPERSAS